MTIPGNQTMRIQSETIRAVEDHPHQEASEGAGKTPEMRLLRKEDETASRDQGMEAMGRLAGGIAHVFNNLLTAISCEVELALTRLPADEPARKNLREIERAGERG